MKFKHGVVAGAVGAFVVLVGRVAVAEHQRMEEQAGTRVEEDHKIFNKGFEDGKNFFRSHHQINHPDCGKCPH